MDQELIAYLDARFHENAQRLEEGLAETRQGLAETNQALAGGLAEVRQGLAETNQALAGGLAEVRQGLAEVRQGLAETRQGLAETNQALASGLAETRQGFAEVNLRFERLEDDVHQTRILVEDMRGDIRLLAEGVSGFDGKLDAVRIELKEEIGEVRSLLHLSYRDLDQRVG